MTPKEAQEKLEAIREAPYIPIRSNPKDDSFFLGFMQGLECGKYPSVKANKEEPGYAFEAQWKVHSLPEHYEADAWCRKDYSEYIWIGGTGYIVTIELHPGNLVQIVIELSNVFKRKIPYMESEGFYQIRKITVPRNKKGMNEMFSLILSKLRDMQAKYHTIREDEEGKEKDNFMKGL